MKRKPRYFCGCIYIKSPFTFYLFEQLKNRMKIVLIDIGIGRTDCHRLIERSVAHLMQIFRSQGNRRECISPAWLDGDMHTCAKLSANQVV